MQATLDAITGENQSAAVKNKNITYIFHHSTSNWCYAQVKQQSCLNIFNFLWIFHREDWDFTDFASLFYGKFVICKFILPFLSLVMETDLFTKLELRTPISNLKLKKWSLSEPSTPIWGVRQGCPLSYCYMLLWLRYLSFSLMLIQGLKEYK